MNKDYHCPILEWRKPRPTEAAGWLAELGRAGPPAPRPPWLGRTQPQHRCSHWTDEETEAVGVAGVAEPCSPPASSFLAVGPITGALGPWGPLLRRREANGSHWAGQLGRWREVRGRVHRQRPASPECVAPLITLLSLLFYWRGVAGSRPLGLEPPAFLTTGQCAAPPAEGPLLLLTAGSLQHRGDIPWCAQALRSPACSRACESRFSIPMATEGSVLPPDPWPSLLPASQSFLVRSHPTGGPTLEQLIPGGPPPPPPRCSPSSPP